MEGLILMHEGTTRFTVVSLLAFVGLALSNEAFAQTDACAEGYVWREAFAADRVCAAKERRDLVADENRNAEKTGKGDECEPGYVWRMAGPQDHVCVTQIERDQAQQDNSLATSRSAAFVATRKPSEILGVRARTPPRKAGCFKYENDEWRETECLSEEYIRRNFPPPALQYSIKSNPQFIFSPRLEPFLYTMPIRVGSVKISHLSDPAVATVTDTLAGKDAFSIQVNTNLFPQSSGNTGWVQFVLQSRPGIPDGLCVWLVDVTVARRTANAAGYTPICTSVPKQRFVWGPGASASHQTTFVGIGAEINETSEVAGLVDDTQSDGVTRLTAWAYVPWAPFTAFAVTTNDTIGLRGRWTEMSGDIIGFGNGSRADFTRTKLRNVLEATSCIFNECPNVERLGTLQKYTTSSVQNVTAESNNLASYYDFELHTPVFSCAQETCTLDYSTGPLSLRLYGVENRPPFFVYP
jgi:hypothetical protein